MGKLKIHTLTPGERYFLLGNHAIARGAIEAGIGVAAAYPGTPSSEILEALAEAASDLGFHAEWSTNEKIALEVAAGAAYSGVRALAAMKHVGVNVSLDTLATLAYTGCEAGLVLVSADDPGAHSSQNEQDNRYIARLTKIPCIEPYDVQSAKEYTIKAFEISEKFSIPVMLRSTTRVSHAKGDVLVGELPDFHARAHFKKNFSRYVCIPANARVLHRALNRKLKEIQDFADKSDLNRMEINGDLGVIVSGVSINYVREAVKSLSIEASILEIGISNPFPQGIVKKFLQQVNKVLVVEELEPFLEENVRALAPDLDVHGKDVIPREGELSTGIVKRALGEIAGIEVELPQRRVDIAIPPRPPVLCPGCGHRFVFYALKKLTRKKIYSGDIGCYTLGALEPLKAMDTCLCMGASLGLAQGFYHAGVEEDVIAIVGDSTFLHAGLPSLINAVYNKADILVVILDNRTTAMTGHQPHPGTGVTAKGEQSKAIDFVELVKAMKVDFVAKVKPSNFEELVRVLKEALNAKGVRVVIAEEPCALLGRKLGLWKTPPEVDRDSCEGYLCRECRACLRIGCPAVGWREGRAEIIPELCTGCDLCVEVCPNDAIRRERR